MALKDREVEFPGRIKLINVNTGEELGVFDMIRQEGEITEEGTPINAESLTNEINEAAAAACAELNEAISVDANNNVSFKNRQSGSVKICPTAVKQTKKVTVKFPKAFNKVPTVTVTPYSTAPGVISCSVSNVQTTQFDLYMYRATKVDTWVYWQAEAY